jgi:hypothetical protein
VVGGVCSNTDLLNFIIQHREMSSSPRKRGHVGDLDPPPWLHPPWLTTRTHRPRPTTSAPPPVGDEKEGKRIRACDAAAKDLIHDEEELVNFFGQLWVIHFPPPRRPRVPVTPVAAAAGTLCWICKDLVQWRAFRPKDCFPVKSLDRIDTKPISISFSREIWGQGQEGGVCSYSQARHG